MHGRGLGVAVDNSAIVGVDVAMAGRVGVNVGEGEPLEANANIIDACVIPVASVPPARYDCLSALMVSQSSLRMPPVSPESGFQHQKVH